MKFSVPFSKCFCSSSESDTVVVNQIKGEQGTANFRVFSFNELKAATQGFRNKLGEGGFGSVYKGQLKDGTFVAVKVLRVELESMRGEREFISEIAALSDIKHENLVTLRGCCVDGAKRLLVYDYMENNSLLHTFLAGGEQNRTSFSWSLRREIALGVAKGLSYLHEEVKPHIAHRDIKSSNILLDENLRPKVSDFGLARIFRDNISHISTRVAGTLGYLSPEYAVSGHLTRKSDVYSFGVLLLEIVSGQPVLDFNLERGEQFLVDKAWQMLNLDKLVNLVDPVLRGDFPEEEAARFLKVGLLCVQETTKLRPWMSTVVKMLTNEIDIQGLTVSQPGLVDLMDLKVGSKDSTTSLFSKGSTTMSSRSPAARRAFTS